MQLIINVSKIIDSLTANSPKIQQIRLKMTMTKDK